MSRGCAPSVTRMPISPVRCATEYAITLYRPIAASSNPSPLSTLKRLAAIFAPKSDAATYSVIGSASKTVSAGSIAVASRRSAVRNRFIHGSGRSHIERQAIVRPENLPDRNVEVRLRTLRNPVILAVLSHSHDREPLAPTVHLAPDHAAVGQKAPHELLIDDH